MRGRRDGSGGEEVADQEPPLILHNAPVACLALPKLFLRRTGWTREETLALFTRADSKDRI
jgi:hypothetical protein